MNMDSTGSGRFFRKMTENARAMAKINEFAHRHQVDPTSSSMPGLCPSVFGAIPIVVPAIWGGLYLASKAEAIKLGHSESKCKIHSQRSEVLR
jgi:hypothetical protein